MITKPLEEIEELNKVISRRPKFNNTSMSTLLGVPLAVSDVSYLDETWVIACGYCWDVRWLQQIIFEAKDFREGSASLVNWFSDFTPYVHTTIEEYHDHHDNYTLAV